MRIRSADLTWAAAIALCCMAPMRTDAGGQGPCAQLQARLASLEGALISLEGPVLPGNFRVSPAPRPLSSDARRQAAQLSEQIAQARAAFDRCEAPPAPEPAAGPYHAPNIRPPDPQIAVGRDYVLAIDTSDLVFYRRSQMKPVPTVGASPTFSAKALFSSLFVTIDKRLAKPPHALPPNACDWEDPHFDATFDAKHPDRHIPGCITSAYDTRVLYDTPHHAFWIASAIRNWLWHCKDSSVGATILEDDTSIADHAPGTQTNRCHKNWDARWAHRMIGVAVTRTGVAGREDLSRKFFTYALDDDYADWPQMAVHAGLLALVHRSSGDPIAIFDADAMEAGRRQGALQLAPLALVPGFVASVPNGEDIPVNVHDAGAPMLLLGADPNGSNHVMVVAIRRGKASQVRFARLMVNLPRAISFKGIRHNPVFRNGVLYVASYEGDGPCRPHDLRLVRIPLRFGASGQLHLGSGGIRDERIESERSAAPELPAVEVTASNDVVVSFVRAAVNNGSCGPFSPRYLVAYHDRTGIGPSRALQTGTGTAVQDAGEGHIDLGGIAVDPLDDRTVWFSHAVSDGAGFGAAFGAVKP